jgi:carboxypeptidase C (cathepsin A)
VLDSSGNSVAAVTFTAYLLEDSGDGDRPITFAINGGPGSASVTLNIGGLGPKRLILDPKGSPQWTDNTSTWLAFTDLVFIDPVGTGFSRSFLPPAAGRAAFFTYDTDVAYLAQFIFDWLQHHGRMRSPKHLVGESYSGYRAPRIVDYLHERLNVSFNSLVLVSPLMNQDQSKNIDVLPSPTTWMATLTTAAAAELERHSNLSAGAMEKVEDYARSDYAVALLDGWRHPEKRATLVDKVAAMTGVSTEYLTETAGRIEPHSYLRGIYQREGKLANYYDVNIAYAEPFPVPNDDGTQFEALIDNTVPQRGAAMTDFITNVVGWKPLWRYLAFSQDVNDAFVWARGTNSNESYSALRRTLVQNPRLEVLLAHGYTDMACPYFADVLAVDQIPAVAGRDRVRIAVYPGGHVFYNRSASLAAFTADARNNY